jgi:PAS domain-containing protein
MPQMDGWTPVPEWKADARLTSIPFMFYTATYTEPKDEALLSLGADCFMVKPEPEVLVETIKTLLWRGSPESVAGGSARPDPFAGADSELAFVKQHRDVVIRKLEHKMAEVESANEALRRDAEVRLRTEAALRESEARFQLLAEVSPVGIFQADSGGATTYVNRRWTEITGMAAEDALGDGWFRAVHPEDRDDCPGSGSRRSSRAATRWRLPLRPPDGTIAG